MKKYIKIAFETRGYPIDGSFIPMCEMCGVRKARDCDHIDGRGGRHNVSNRMYDPRNLILLCRECHQNKGGYEWKQKAKEIVKKHLLNKYLQNV